METIVGRALAVCYLPHTTEYLDAKSRCHVDDIVGDALASVKIYFGLYGVAVESDGAEWYAVIDSKERNDNFSNDIQEQAKFAMAAALQRAVYDRTYQVVIDKVSYDMVINHHLVAELAHEDESSGDTTYFAFPVQLPPFRLRTQ
jgi:hypothetical protein